VEQPDNLYFQDRKFIQIIIPIHQTSWHHISEDINIHCHENFRSYEGSSESFHPFIFLKKMESAGGMGVGGIVKYIVTDRQGKPVDLVVGVLL
jgi:hypothetical protein